MNNKILEDIAERYQLFFYMVGDIYEEDQAGNLISIEDKNKWFVATTKNSEFLEEVMNLPLGNTLEDIVSMTLEYFKIDLKKCTKENKKLYGYCICSTCKKNYEKEELEAKYETAMDGWYD